MRISLILALAITLSACHQTSDPDPQADSLVSSAASQTPTADDSASSSQEASSAEALPSDVLAFVSQRDECEHWLGEEPYDNERGKEISDAINATCTGTDKKLSALRRKYKDRSVVLEALASYDDKIEN